MATKQGKKSRVKVRNLFSKNKYKKFSKSKEHVRLRKESEESLDDVLEESKDLSLKLETSRREVSTSSPQQSKRRSVKLHLGDLLYGGQGGLSGRKPGASSAGDTGNYTEDEAEGERNGKGSSDEEDIDLRLVTTEDEETSLIDPKTTEKLSPADIVIHTDSGGEKVTETDKNAHNSADSDAKSSTRLRKEAASSKKVEGKAKLKRKKVSFSPTSTKYIQLEASQEALEVYVVEEQTIRKKKSKKKKIKKGMRKAARLSWRYLVAGFRNMTLVTPFYVTTTTVESLYHPQRPSHP